jgi:predicted hydrocarbon binding protein
MLSAFLKRLLFARQFYMINGRIDILGQKQVMIPADLIPALQEINPNKVYKAVKSAIKKDIEIYAKKLGSSEQGMLKSIEDIFETFGLGKLEIIDLDQEKKRTIVRVHESPPVDSYKNKKTPVCAITPGVLAGMFSFLFGKDLNAKFNACMAKGKAYCEFVIK